MNRKADFDKYKNQDSFDYLFNTAKAKESVSIGNDEPKLGYKGRSLKFAPFNSKIELGGVFFLESHNNQSLIIVFIKKKE